MAERHSTLLYLRHAPSECAASSYLHLLTSCDGRCKNVRCGQYSPCLLSDNDPCYIASSLKQYETSAKPKG